MKTWKMLGLAAIVIGIVATAKIKKIEGPAYGLPSKTPTEVVSDSLWIKSEYKGYTIIGPVDDNTARTFNKYGTGFPPKDGSSVAHHRFLQESSGTFYEVGVPEQTKPSH